MLGIKCKLYYGTGTWGTGLTEMEDVTEATLSMPKSEATVTTRGSYPFELTEPILIQASISIILLATPNSSDVRKLISAYMNNTVLELAALDGDQATPGSQGLHADCKITGMERPEPAGDVLRYQFTAKPCRSTNKPEWLVIEE